jgi:hypothetical protein
LSDCFLRNSQNLAKINSGPLKFSCAKFSINLYEIKSITGYLNVIGWVVINYLVIIWIIYDDCKEILYSPIQDDLHELMEHHFGKVLFAVMVMDKMTERPKVQKYNHMYAEGTRLLRQVYSYPL